MKPHILLTLSKWLIPLSATLIIIFSAIGILINACSFLENILPEMVGIFASVIISLFIVDKYIEQQRKQQWDRVRNLTFQALAAHLCDLTTEVFMYFPVIDINLMTPIIEGRDRPNPLTISAMEDLISQLSELPSAVSAEKSTSDLSVEFYEAIKWDLDQIQDVLTPRVVQSYGDQQIIDGLIEFDDARRKLHNAIIVHKQITLHTVFPDTLELLNQALNLYKLLCSNKWE